MKVFFCHGVSHFETSPNWEEPIRDVLEKSFGFLPDEREYGFFAYDELFDRDPISLDTYAQAFFKLAGNWVWFGISDFLHRARGLADIPDEIRWTAGMVAQWANDPGLQSQLRAALLKQINAFKPDLVIGHSMGSLISYDTLTESGVGFTCGPFQYLTLGCQVGHPTVRSVFGGRIVYPTDVASWLHLFNPKDIAFTHEIRDPQMPPTGQFRQVTIDAGPNINGLANHHLETYLFNPEAEDQLRVWLQPPSSGVRAMLSNDGPLRVDTSSAAKPMTLKKPVKTDAETSPTTDAAVDAQVTTSRNRALLVGINQYSDPANNLQGCVNDVFEMSACLQESGMRPEDIRIVLDQRATTSGVLERMGWLLEDVRPGDNRVFFFSGHGTRYPVHDADGVSRSFVEAIVTHDFDWKDNMGIADHQLQELYAQLPYDSNLLVMLDSCHSGGMTKDSARVVRALNPPDDIRHRFLKWDLDSRMWTDRDETPTGEKEPGEDFSLNRSIQKAKPTWFGPKGATYRIGVAAGYRNLSERDYKKTCERKKHMGPYMPVVLTACKDTQFSFEYRHGVTSFGAFTFALTSTLRDLRNKGTAVDYEDLAKTVGKKLVQLKYDQTPTFVGPTVRLTARVPSAFSSRGPA